MTPKDLIEEQRRQIISQESDLMYIQNEMEDVLSPAVCVMEQSQLILQMMMLNNEFIRKKRLTSGAKEGKERLERLLELNLQMHKITDQSYVLKLRNRDLLAINQQQRKKIKELERTIENVEKAANF